MKKIIFTYIALMIVVILSSCYSKRSPGRVYMPDMAYSRAYETYAYRDSTAFTSEVDRRGGSAIYFDNKPAKGTIKRDEIYPYTLPNDSNGYKMSAAVVNPVSSMAPAEMDETQRLFNINCAICHGPKGTGDGPLAASGKVAGVANLTGSAYLTMADGTMFHTITYGKNNMGSYASQLNRMQRWQVIKFIRTLQAKATPAPPATGAAPVKDSTVKKG